MFTTLHMLSCFCQMTLPQSLTPPHRPKDLTVHWTSCRVQPSRRPRRWLTLWCDRPLDSGLLAYAGTGSEGQGLFQEEQAEACASIDIWAIKFLTSGQYHHLDNFCEDQLVEFWFWQIFGEQNHKTLIGLACFWEPSGTKHILRYSATICWFRDTHWDNKEGFNLSAIWWSQF